MNGIFCDHMSVVCTKYLSKYMYNMYNNSKPLGCLPHHSIHICLFNNLAVRLLCVTIDCFWWSMCGMDEITVSYEYAIIY